MRILYFNGMIKVVLIKKNEHSFFVTLCKDLDLWQHFKKV